MFFLALVLLLIVCSFIWWDILRLRQLMWILPWLRLKTGRLMRHLIQPYNSYHSAEMYNFIIDPTSILPTKYTKQKEETPYDSTLMPNTRKSHDWGEMYQMLTYDCSTLTYNPYSQCDSMGTHKYLFSKIQALDLVVRSSITIVASHELRRFLM